MSMRSSVAPGHGGVEQRCTRSSARRRAPVPAAPSPARSRGRSPTGADRGSRREHLAARGQHEQQPDERERRPVLGTARQHGAEGSRDQESAETSGQDRASSRHYLGYSAPAVSIESSRGLRQTLTARSDFFELESAPCGGGLNPCAFGLSAVCWARTRSTTSATRSGSSRSRSWSTTGRRRSRPTAGFFLFAKFLPALLATGLTAQLDRYGAAQDAAVALRRRGRRVRRCWPSWPTAIGSSCRWCSRSALVDGTLAITGRGLTRGAVGGAAAAEGPAHRGQRADEPRASPPRRCSARRSPAC